MLVKITFLFLLSFTLSISAQNEHIVFDQGNFIGSWSMKNSHRDPSKTYLIKLQDTNNYVGYGANFFIGKYTGKRKVESFKQGLKNPKCGNDDGYYHYNNFLGYPNWQYDESTRILEVSNSYGNHRRGFKVTLLNPNELLLIEIK